MKTKREPAFAALPCGRYFTPRPTLKERGASPLERRVLPYKYKRTLRSRSKGYVKEHVPKNRYDIYAQKKRGTDAPRL